MGLCLYILYWVCVLGPWSPKKGDTSILFWFVQCSLFKDIIDVWYGLVTEAWDKRNGKHLLKEKNEMSTGSGAKIF